MADYNIEISQLNRPPATPRTEDFLPLVHSASMTTYRTTLQDIGSLITHSIYADTASVLTAYPATVSASYASASLSASYALTASYAISASHANLADSASFYPPQQFQSSCSWASTSLQAYYATTSADVDTFGTPYNFPYWTSIAPGQGNGNLQQNSPVVYYPVGTYDGLTMFDSASTGLVSSFPYAERPDFQLWTYGDQANSSFPFQPNRGIQSHWPITSHTFIGTDQKGWYFSTASNPFGSFPTNSYFSGSAGDASSGSFYTIPGPPTNGGLASVFNGKWVRFVSFGGNPADGNFTSYHSSMGEVSAFADQIMKGLISVVLQTTVLAGGSNAWNQVDLWVHGGAWGGGQSATILHVHNYGPQLIRAFRISTHGGGGIDPVYSIDMLIDGLYGNGDGGGQGEPVLLIYAQSWQGIRFLEYLNVDPWPFAAVGNPDISQDVTQLIVPAAPGYYSNSPLNINYYIQGKNVVIWPNPNELTQSGLAVPSQAISQSLYVSGGINTNTSFYCDGHQGLTTTINYGTTYMYFSGGILVGKYPPPPAAPVVTTPPVTNPTSSRPGTSDTFVTVYGVGAYKNGRTDDYHLYLNGNNIGILDGTATDAGTLIVGTTHYISNLSALGIPYNLYYQVSPSFFNIGTNRLAFINFQDTGVVSTINLEAVSASLDITTGQIVAVKVLDMKTVTIQGGNSYTYTFTT